MTRRTSKGSAAQSIVLAQEWLVSNSRGASRKLRFRHGDVEVVSGMELAELYYFTGNLSDDESVSANSFRLQQRTEPLLKDVAESLQALLGAASKARRAMDTYDRILNQFFEGGASSLQESSKRRRNTLVEIVAKTRELCSQTPQLAKRERGGSDRGDCEARECARRDRCCPPNGPPCEPEVSRYRRGRAPGRPAAPARRVFRWPAQEMGRTDQGCRKEACRATGGCAESLGPIEIVNLSDFAGW